MVPLGMYCTVNAVAAVTTLRHVVVLLWVRFVAPAAAESCVFYHRASLGGRLNDFHFYEWSTIFSINVNTCALVVAAHV